MTHNHKDTIMTFAEETKQAIARIVRQYMPDLEAAGLGDLVHVGADNPEADPLTLSPHPLWHEFVHRLNGQVVTPEFIEAGRCSNALHADGKGRTAEGMKAFARMYDLAPEWFKDEMHGMAKSLSLIPEPAGYDDSGEPFYSLDAVADKLGVSPGELVDKAHEMGVKPVEASARVVH